VGGKEIERGRGKEWEKAARESERERWGREKERTRMWEDKKGPGKYKIIG